MLEVVELDVDKREPDPLRGASAACCARCDEREKQLDIKLLSVLSDLGGARASMVTVE